MAVADGDTFTLLTPDRRQIKVRLAQIDAPEKGQPWGAKAKKMLSDQIVGKTLRIEITSQDRFGRSVAEVFVGSTHVNAALVKAGAAWAYTPYVTDSRFASYERSARAERRGLWAMPPGQTIAPWNWRAIRRDHLASQSTAMPSGLSSSRAVAGCGEKRLCRQMTSCDEARFFLHQCHLVRLDGDGDGVPCEALCRAR